MCWLNFYVFGALCFVVIALILKWTRGRKPQGTTCTEAKIVLSEVEVFSYPDGPDPSDPVFGNLGDIAKHGSLHEYLAHLHNKFGPITTFYWQDKRIVSVMDVDSFKRLQRLFDRPVLLFSLIMPLIGEGSIQYANGENGKKRRKLMDPAFAHSACGNMHPLLVDVAKKTVDQWTDAGDKIDATSSPIEYALRSILTVAFDESFLEHGDAAQAQEDDAIPSLEEIRKAYNIAWSDMESRMDGSMPEPGSEREREFAESVEFLLGAVDKIVARRSKRRDMAETRGEDIAPNFLDIISASSLYDPSVVANDAISMMVGGFHTTGNQLAWTLYYLAKHQDVQDRVRDELTDALLTPRGDTSSDSDLDDITTGPVNSVLGYSQMNKLTYMKAVLNETLRCAQVGPWAARISDKPVAIRDDVLLPPNTPIIISLGNALMSTEYWDDPEEFNPDRFLKDDQSFPAFAFKPFGFAGKRQCPGYRFSTVNAQTLLCELLPRFRLVLAEENEGMGEVKRVYGLVTHPSRSIPIYLRSHNGTDRDE
eukprot:TRINITY_DN471_c0_g1_i1.p1 TRINITY_DN471_c0_g1~~TRINITY_DN471_c0_g1_i1.p1  ORF type:complete len:536 (+),score=65.73 TRINITY_DN471_c0_g1_i1:187-1794(+)